MKHNDFNQVLSSEEVFKRISSRKSGERENYLAMYSTWFGGVTKDPALMMIPIDDHGFHRGDAVFEAIKCIGGKVYAMDRHFERLYRSAKKIGLEIKQSIDQLKDIALNVVRIAGAKDCMIRCYASRGPGGFTANPYESIGTQFYLVVTSYKPYPTEKYHSGVSATVSTLKVKEAMYASIKSCNYLQNVLMKKEAVDQGVDFCISVDEGGNLAESSTENFAVISAEGEFLIPGFERTLRGITVVRLMELSEKLVAAGTIKSIRHGAITTETVVNAREAMMIGTTLDCLPVTSFEGKKIADGNVGPVCKELMKLLEHDLAEGPLCTSVAID